MTMKKVGDDIRAINLLPREARAEDAPRKGLGRGLSALMGDMAKGIKSFKAGMAEDDQVTSKPQENAEGDDAEVVQASVVNDETVKR